MRIVSHDTHLKLRCPGLNALGTAPNGFVLQPHRLQAGGNTMTSAEAWFRPPKMSRTRFSMIWSSSSLPLTREPLSSQCQAPPQHPVIAKSNHSIVPPGFWSAYFCFWPFGNGPLFALQRVNQPRWMVINRTRARLRIKTHGGRFINQLGYSPVPLFPDFGFVRKPK